MTRKFSFYKFTAFSNPYLLLVSSHSLVDGPSVICLDHNFGCYCHYCLCTAVAGVCGGNHDERKCLSQLLNSISFLSLPMISDNDVCWTSLLISKLDSKIHLTECLWIQPNKIP